MNKLIVAFALCVVATFAQTDPVGPVQWTYGDTKVPIAFSPPVIQNPVFPVATDSTLVQVGGYMKALNWFGAAQAANTNNALAWHTFQNAWAAWVPTLSSCAAGTVCIAPPKHPVYQYFDTAKFEAYWTDFCKNPDMSGNCHPVDFTVIPGSYGVPSGVGEAFIPLVDTVLTVVQPKTNIPANLLGAYIGDGKWGCVPNDPTPDKTVFQNIFVKHLVATPMGASCWWTYGK